MEKMMGSNRWVPMLLLIVAWYVFSLHLNVTVKEALLIYPDAHALTAIQFIVAATTGRILQCMKLMTRADLSSDDVKAHLLPIAIFFYLGNLCTNCALGSISVGFTHILKTLEPLCAVGIARVVLGGSPPSGSWFGLLTILCGVGTVIISDLNFNLIGMFFALTSNVFLPLRNVYSTALMGRDTTTRISTFQLFFATTQLSALIAGGMQLIKWFVVAIIFPNETPSISSVINWDLLIAGVSFTAMHSTSYVILERLQPISHALMNCFKRAFIIFGSAVVLGTGLRMVQVIGIALALIGLHLYSRAKKGRSGFQTIQISKFVMILSIIALLFSLKSAFDRTFSPSPGVDDGASLTNHLRKLSSNFGVFGGALPYIVRKAFKAENVLDPFAPPIHYVWLHPVPVSESAMQNIDDIASYANVVVHCGSEECEAQMEYMKKNGKVVTVRPLIAPVICKDTPLYRWIKKHVFYKLQAGPNYEKQLKQVIALCIFYQMGGIYVDDSVTLNANLDLTKLPTRPWMSDQKGLFHVGYFPPKDEMLITMMKNYVENYPDWQRSGTEWPSVYDFTDLVEMSGTRLAKVDVAAVGFTTRQVMLPANARQYATMKYDLRSSIYGVNLGDEVQTFGGIQFLPHIDHFLTRDLLHTYKFDNNVTFFINAWIGDPSFDWPYQPYMDPIMVAIHLVDQKYTSSDHKIQYLKSKAPIGARDTSTLNMLQEKNIPSYFSGCATILIQNPYKQQEKGRTIYVVDVYEEDALMRVIPDEIKGDVVFVTHGPRFHNLAPFDNIGRFLYAADLMLEKYAKARAIITQRIHAAMPNVGLGVPVIFFGTNGLPDGSASRLTGLTDMWHFIHTSNQSETQIKARMKELFANNGPHGNPNPELELQIKNKLFSHILSRHTRELRNTALMFGVIDRNAQFDSIDVTETDEVSPPSFDSQLANVTYGDTRPH